MTAAAFATGVVERQLASRKEYPVESRFIPEWGFGATPGELLTISKPDPYPKSEKPPARKGFTKPNL